jgi:uncharacterized cupredoxin-like copper-binding protein
MNRRNMLTAALLAGSAGLARAHGEKIHAAPAAARKKEQKPWGIAGDPKDVQRTIATSMTDGMRFTPDRIEVRLGETVRFRLKNNGKLMHEFVMGTRKDLDEHAELMRRFPNMEHDEPYMAHVPPGKTGEIVWTFNRPGTFGFACLIGGHFQAGMIGNIKVVPI